MATQWLMPDQEIETKDSGTDQEELFVFGYACKVFRDDEKAQYIDDGRHLIPWMGDDRLLIDRYDGRGHLYDLSQYDVSNVKMESKALSDEEKQIEALCDEERYLELHTDVAEKKMYEEEEWKRYYETLSEGYNAVGFSYDYQHQQDYQQTAALIEEKPFVVPEEIQVPAGMIVPTTEKVHAIIEKTAKFIAGHGIQMEIIIKTKQKDNAQFNFMHFDDEMNPYYKHVVQMIKSGKYKPKVEEKQEEEDHDNEDHSHHHGYLHPSLMPRRVSPTPEVGITIQMPKVSVHDTPYGQLIKSLKKTDEKHAEKTSKKNQKKNSEQPAEKVPPPPPPIPSYMSESVYGPAHSGMPLPPGIEPVTLPSSNQPPPPGTDLAGPILPRYKHKSEEIEDEEEEEEPLNRNSRPQGIVPPPPDIQPIIDRMAMYVAKNGEEFEIVVKSKSDTRFDFLHSWHTHFPYYNFKKNLELKEIQKLKKKQELEKPKGVSFSIKNKVKEQDSVALEKRQVFDNESSDDERDGEIDGYKLSRSDVSGASTPVDGSFSTEYRSEYKTDRASSSTDKRQAEEKLKDRLAAAAREKLAQASKEKQMQAERKRKVAMFVNMLKSTNQQPPGQSGDENRDEHDLGLLQSVTTPSGTPLGSRSQTPVNWDENSMKDSTNGDVLSRSSKRSRDRSRSITPKQFRRSPSPLPFSRSRRSRSRSPRRRRRSPTPPSAYSRRRRTMSRSPIRWGVPRPPSPPRRSDRSRSPRYSRTRSRSPSISSVRRRDRSRSPRSSKNKSPVSSTRKRSRSRSPSRSKSTKKDRKSSPSSSSRSSKKSKKKKKSRSRSPSSKSKTKKSDVSEPTEIVIINDDSPEVDSRVDTQVAVEPLEEGEIDSRLSPVVEEESSPSRIPQLSDLPMVEAENSIGRSTPNKYDEGSNSPYTDTGTESKPPENQKNVSNYMLSRVRAIIKASRQAVLEEEGPLDDL